jgi:hypothetical protein
MSSSRAYYEGVMLRHFITRDDKSAGVTLQGLTTVLQLPDMAVSGLFSTLQVTLTYSVSLLLPASCTRQSVASEVPPALQSNSGHTSPAQSVSSAV